MARTAGCSCAHTAGMRASPVAAIGPAPPRRFSKPEIEQVNQHTHVIVLHASASDESVLSFSMFKNRRDEAFVQQVAQNVRAELRVVGDAFPTGCLVCKKTRASNVFLALPKTQLNRRGVRGRYPTCITHSNDSHAAHTLAVTPHKTKQNAETQNANVTKQQTRPLQKHRNLATSNQSPPPPFFE